MKSKYMMTILKRAIKKCSFVEIIKGDCGVKIGKKNATVPHYSIFIGDASKPDEEEDFTPIAMGEGFTLEEMFMDLLNDKKMPKK